MFQLFILIMQTALQFMLYIMINQYQLMSHLTVQQGKFGRFELGTTSKYICNYIEQRKALMLAKLARNSSTSDSNIDQIADLPKNVNIKQVDRRNFKQESKGHMRKKTSEVSCLQKSNKINKYDHNHRQNDSNKFLVRSSLYQKQKNLNFQVQKKKVFFTEAQSHSFHPILLKTDESIQSRMPQKKSQKVQQTYTQRHERKHSRNLSQQRVNYKDLIKQSMTKFDKNQQKLSAIRQEKNRWRAIQEMFEKVQIQQTVHNQTIKIDEQQTCKIIREKDSTQQQLHRLEVNQFMISLKKINSEQQSINNMDQNLKIQQHFEQDLSGILIDEDVKEEVDSSHVFQQVMNDMMPQIELVKPECILQKQVAEAEVARTISVLEQSSTQKAQHEVNINSYDQFKHIAEDQWIKKEEKENNSQQQILIKNVESQIIENCDVQFNNQQSQQVLAQSKVQKLPQHPSIQIQDSVNNQSLIDKLSEQLIEEVPLKQVIINQQQQINDRQRQSLQALANQFMFLKNDKKSSEDDQDLDIPEEQCPTVALQCFNFNIISHEFTQNTVVRAILLPESIASIQTQQFVSLHELNQIQTEQTIQQIYQAQQFQYQESKMNVLISSLKNFGEFLVIPEESEQESHQSVQ